jgi:hypothetical protein
MSPALSRYLKDFSAEMPPVAPPPVMPDMSFMDEPVFADIPEAPVVDVEAERREAYAEGHEAATQDLQEKHQAEIEALNAAHRAELDAIHARYAGEIAERVSANIREIAGTLGEAVGTETARALSPILTENLTARAIEDLSALITAAILDGSAGPVVVSGPRNLFDRLSDHLGEHAELLRHVEAQDIDLTVTMGEGVLVTRMSAWADSLRKVLE